MDIEEFKSRYTQDEMTKSEAFGQDVKDILNDDTLMGELISRAVSGMAEAIADKIGEYFDQSDSFGDMGKENLSDILDDSAFRGEVVSNAVENFKEDFESLKASYDDKSPPQQSPNQEKGMDM